jgi:hypothetical protein
MNPTVYPWGNDEIYNRAAVDEGIRAGIESALNGVLPRIYEDMARLVVETIKNTRFTTPDLDARISAVILDSVPAIISAALERTTVSTIERKNGEIVKVTTAAQV